jgi:hypothetical protein
MDPVLVAGAAAVGVLVLIEPPDLKNGEFVDSCIAASVVLGEMCLDDLPKDNSPNPLGVPFPAYSIVRR